MTLTARPTTYVWPTLPAAIANMPGQLIGLEPAWELHPQHWIFARAAAGADLHPCPQAHCGTEHPWWALTPDPHGPRASLYCPGGP